MDVNRLFGSMWAIMWAIYEEISGTYFMCLWQIQVGRRGAMGHAGIMDGIFLKMSEELSPQTLSFQRENHRKAHRLVLQLAHRNDLIPIQ